jgi:SAM-dependent methyltransferase
MAPSESSRDELFRLIGGYQQSQAIYVAAKLGIADLLREGPKSVAELAEATGAHGPSLYRLLRALASIRIFSEGEGQRFSLTPLAEPLSQDHPESQWAYAVMMGEEHYHVWGDLFFAVETGENAFERIYGMPVFEFLSENPEKGRVFDAAMTSIHGRETLPLLEAYDFTGIGLLADIGGGNGSVLSAILKRHPAMRGVLFDLPTVIDRSRQSIAAAGLADRCELMTGDFFREVPAGAGAYLLRHIIHDWDDERAGLILRNIHRAMKPQGRLLVLEHVISSKNDSPGAVYLDLTMLLIPGGQERTEEEYRRLFATAGFELIRIIPTRSGISVIEGEKS